MINYNVELLFYWGGFLLIYFLLLRRLKFFKTNRIYLIITILIALVLPFIEFQKINIVKDNYVLRLPEIQFIDNLQKPTVDSSRSIDYFAYFYFIISGILLVRLLFNLGAIFRIVRNSDIILRDDISFIYNSKIQTTSSFFKYLFVPVHLKDELDERILLHEKRHIQQLHSIDILFLEFLKVAFWLNPLIYVYSFLFREVHEFDADDIAASSDSKSYFELMLRNISIQEQLKLNNTFFSSQIKSRIMMLNLNPSHKLNYSRYLILIPLIFILCKCSVTGKRNQDFRSFHVDYTDTMEIFDPKTYKSEIKVVRTEYDYYKEAEVYPYLKSCKEMQVKQRQSCTNNEISLCLISKIKMSDEFKNKNNGTKYIFKFLVEESGMVSSENMNHHIPYEINDAILTAFQECNFSFMPGKVQGKAVNVLMQIPVVFKS